MNKSISATIIAAVLALSFTADAKVTRVPRWVHGFQLGASLSTHRQSCNNLKGEWDYMSEECEHPVISKFGSPVIITYDWSWDSENINRKGIQFFYKEYTYQKEWLNYLYKTFGEPNDKYNENDGWYIRWLLDDGLISIEAVKNSKDEIIGYKVGYLLHEVIVEN